MRAIILAGGKGTRLLPYTERVPKPLVSIGENKTILDILLQQLVTQGFTHITLAVNHLADLIIDYIGDGSQQGLKIDYSRETTPLHTIGPITLIKDLPSNFLVINGDTLTNMDYGTFLQEHAKRGSSVSIAVQNRELKSEFGVVEFDADHKLTAFKEKPVHKIPVTIGINAISRETIDRIPPGTWHGFDDLLKDSLHRNDPVHVHEHAGFWLDIGRPADYVYAVENYEEIKKLLKL